MSDKDCSEKKLINSTGQVENVCIHMGPWWHNHTSSKITFYVVINDFMLPVVVVFLLNLQMHDSPI